MPKIKKNVNRADLTKNDRLEFEAVGFKPEEIDRINELLKLDRWVFWSRPTEMFLSLAGGEQLVMTSGKAVLKDFSSSIHFSQHYAEVSDRKTAKLVFMSDAYREKRVKLSPDHERDMKESAYQRFHDEVLRDPEMAKRVQEDLSARFATAG